MVETEEQRLVRRQPAALWSGLALLFAGPLNPWFVLLFLMVMPHPNASAPAVMDHASFLIASAVWAVLLILVCGRRTRGGVILWVGAALGGLVAALYAPALALWAQGSGGATPDWDQILLQDVPGGLFLGSFLWAPAAFFGSLTVRLLAYRRS
jgi:hypothetical protein